MKKKRKVRVTTAAQQEALRKIAESKAKYVIGIDEVGVGCWAGPIAVAGVVVPKDWDHPDVMDSKRFSTKKRMHRVLLEAVYPAALAKCVLSHQAETVDELGIEESQRHLMEGVAVMLRHRFPGALVVEDGLPVPIDGSMKRVIALPQADDLVPAVSAASMLAKVSRDLFMMEQHKIYPEYGFDTNVGYHSLKHKLALREHGPTPLHRRSFRPIQNIILDRKRAEEHPSVPLTAKLFELVNS